MEDITLYAGWRYNAPATERHTVTFDLNYEGAPTPESKSVDDEALITEPEAPVRDGYRFTGWYREAACTTPFDFESDRITEDTTLYAGWTGSNIKIVTFHMMDGTKINEKIEGDTIPTGKLPYIGGTDTFQTWFKDEEGIEVFDFSSPISGDTDIYANEYSVEGVTVSNKGVLTTDKSFREGLSGTFVIPFGITEIDNSAFSSCSNLESVIIPDSVTSIDSNAFSGCSGLTEIYIPGNVASIGDSAFRACNNLTSISLPAAFEGKIPDDRWGAPDTADITIRE